MPVLFGTQAPVWQHRKCLDGIAQNHKSVLTKPSRAFTEVPGTVLAADGRAQSLPLLGQGIIHGRHVTEVVFLLGIIASPCIG